jgi:hypothetical protein
MALIGCPECGRQVSDQVPACLYCGYVLKPIMAGAPPSSLSEGTDRTSMHPDLHKRLQGSGIGVSPDDSGAMATAARPVIDPASGTTSIPPGQNVRRAEGTRGGPRSIIRRVPGFRSGRSWKSIIASVAYLSVAFWVTIFGIVSYWSIAIAILGGSVFLIAFLTDAESLRTRVARWAGVRRVPGFRTAVWWKSAIAVTVYLVLAFSVFVLVVGETSAHLWPVGVWLLVFSGFGIALGTNAESIRTRLPLFRSPDYRIAALAWAGIPIVGIISLAWAVQLSPPNLEYQAKAPERAAVATATAEARVEIARLQAVARDPTASRAETERGSATAVVARTAAEAAATAGAIGTQTAEAESRAAAAVATQTAEVQVAEAQLHLDNAAAFQAAGQLELALVEANMAAAAAPGWAAAQAAQVQLANAQATAQAQAGEAQALADDRARQEDEARQQATAAAASPAYALDVPGMIGKSLQELRALYGAPRYTEPVRAGILDSAPRGGEVHTYTRDWAVIDFVIASSRVVGIMVYFEKPQPRTYEDALAKLNLPAGQASSTTALAAKRWNNLSGFNVSMSLTRRDGEVAQAIIRRS